MMIKINIIIIIPGAKNANNHALEKKKKKKQAVLYSTHEWLTTIFIAFSNKVLYILTNIYIAPLHLDQSARWKTMQIKHKANQYFG